MMFFFFPNILTYYVGWGFGNLASLSQIHHLFWSRHCGYMIILNIFEICFFIGVAIFFKIPGIIYNVILFEYEAIIYGSFLLRLWKIMNAIHDVALRSTPFIEVAMMVIWSLSHASIFIRNCLLSSRRWSVMWLLSLFMKYFLDLTACLNWFSALDFAWVPWCGQSSLKQISKKHGGRKKFSYTICIKLVWLILH